jgi:hypothetical protein
VRGVNKGYFMRKGGHRAWRQRAQLSGPPTRRERTIATSMGVDNASWSVGTRLEHRPHGGSWGGVHGSTSERSMFERRPNILLGTADERRRHSSECVDVRGHDINICEVSARSVRLRTKRQQRSILHERGSVRFPLVGWSARCVSGSPPTAGGSLMRNGW